MLLIDIDISNLQKIQNSNFAIQNAMSRQWELFIGLNKLWELFKLFKWQICH